MNAIQKVEASLDARAKAYDHLSECIANFSKALDEIVNGKPPENYFSKVEFAPEDSYVKPFKGAVL